MSVAENVKHVAEGGSRTWTCIESETDIMSLVPPARFRGNPFPCILSFSCYYSRKVLTSESKQPGMQAIAVSGTKG